jgi:hypothetical protein
VIPVAIQLATAITTGTARKTRQRPMRNTRMVSLRSSLPTGLVTLRHDVPEYLTRPLATGEATEAQSETTPKVEKAGTVQVQVRIETAARKGH